MFYVNFCDKKYKVIEYNQLFDELDNTVEIFVVNKNKQYFGTIHIDDCRKENWEYWMVHECVYSNNLNWDEIRDNLKKSSTNIMPLLDMNGQVLCFCYLKFNTYIEVDINLKLLEDKDSVAWLDTLYQEKQIVCIYGMNEYAYRFQKICRKKGFKVCLIGEKWKYVEINNNENIWNYPDYARFNIFVEGTDPVIDFGCIHSVEQCFDMQMQIVNEIVYESYRMVFQKVWSRFQKQGISSAVCVVPDVSTFITGDEKYYQQQGVNFGVAADSQFQVSEAQREALARVYNISEIQELLRRGRSADDRGYQIVHAGMPAKSLEKSSCKRRVYLVGPCIVDGQAVLTESNLLSYLQRELYNDGNYDYQMVAVVVGPTDWERLEQTLDRIPIRKMDIVLFIHRKGALPMPCLRNLKKGVLFLDEVYNDVSRKTMFGDNPMHTNAYGNHLLAQKIYKHLLQEFVAQKMDGKSNKYLQKGHWLGVEEELQIHEYLGKIVCQYPDVLSEKNKVGAIVMNCNPFTKGHRYLIEKAKSQVGYLFIFVVEENKSFFSFEDRFEMVKRGVADLKNVIVLPSGKFILSFQTLPVYFDKEEHNEVQVDAVDDLEIFARYVAKELNIKVRFVGEEPIDMVTKQYNQQMFQTLEEFDIDVVEIPRKQILGQVISASKVRSALKNRDNEVLEQMLPETTIEYLRKMGY